MRKSKKGRVGGGLFINESAGEETLMPMSRHSSGSAALQPPAGLRIAGMSSTAGTPRHLSRARLAGGTHS